MEEHPRTLRRTLLRAGTLAGVLFLVCGCKVLTTEADREVRARLGGTFDAGAYVASQWNTRLVPGYAARATDLSALAPGLTANPAAARRDFGSQATEGGDWTFVIKGEGTVVDTDFASRTGSVTVAVPGAGNVRIHTGPVLVSTALRDAIPTLQFDGFSDQLAFASLSKALNDRALTEVRPVVAGLRAGDRVRFTGAVQANGPGQDLAVVPIAVSRAGTQGG